MLEMKIQLWKIKLLMTHINSSLNYSTKNSFDNEIHLFATNYDVKNQNKRCLQNLNCPIVASVVTRGKDNNSMEKYEEDMKLELLIAVGAWVMLTSNIWTYARLVKGALGVIENCITLKFYLQNHLHVF